MADDLLAAYAAMFENVPSALLGEKLTFLHGFVDACSLLDAQFALPEDAKDWMKEMALQGACLAAGIKSALVSERPGVPAND